MEGVQSDLPEQNGQPDSSFAAMVSVEPSKPAYASSVSLSSPEQSEPDSDFATDGAGTAAGPNRPGSSGDEVSDDSTYGAAKRSHCSNVFHV